MHGDSVDFAYNISLTTKFPFLCTQTVNNLHQLLIALILKLLSVYNVCEIGSLALYVQTFFIKYKLEFRCICHTNHYNQHASEHHYHVLIPACIRASLPCSNIIG